MLLLAKNSTLPKLTRNGRLFLGGALLGVLVFVLVFGVSTLDVTNDAFCRGGYIEKDIQQHYAGWLFYRQSSAGWPLCIARGINYPDGLSVAYTDSIPLVAALLKPVANLVGGTFQYMGWFTLVCFALQGGFGALLAGLFLPGCAAPLAADLLFVTSPVLFERVFRHTSLGAQFFVLAALYFYFAAYKKLNGLVLDGPIRDVKSAKEITLPIYATGSTPGGPYKEGPGEINVPISCGGISVNPGDIVVMDDDGVIIIPLKDASAVLAAAQKLQETDEAKVVAAGNGTAKREWVAKAIETKKIEIIDDYY